ncbi:MAG: hypothetical protein ACI9KN_002251 [Gammaproteobacteria bacterium]|jgi:hypothetical protein
MNRQQFNKYLSGQVYPSKHNLGRICHFFKLTEDQLCLNPTEFSQLTSSLSSSEDSQMSGHIDRAIEGLPVDTEALSRYEGYYYSHFHASGFPGSIIRALVRIYRHKDRFYSKAVEHLWDKNLPDAKHQRFKYKGVVLYVGGRIFITEYEILTKQSICHTILFPSYRNVVDRISGLTCGVGSMNSHMPSSTRVEMQFLGKQVDLREALNGCTLIDAESDTIEQGIKDRIKNEILPHEFILAARNQ